MTVSGELSLVQVAEAFQRGALTGVKLAGEHVLQVSNTHVPLEEGTLERSGVVDAATDDQGAASTVSYDTPYAVIQHEDLEFHHDADRTAKYLENALNATAGVALEIIGQAIKNELGGPAKL